MPAHHILVGGGPAATNALETIRQFDHSESRITLISDEPAHSRMALPYWLCGNIPREQTLTGDEAYFQALGVETRWGRRVAAIDPAGSVITLDDGEALAYDNLLLATGSTPLQPSIPGADLPGVQSLWTLGQTESILQLAQQVAEPRVVLVGAGFIGFIMLNAMFKRGWRLTVVEREAQVLPRMLDAAAAKLVRGWLDERGVTTHTGVSVQSIEAADDGGKIVSLSNGKQVEADLVVLGIGVRSNIDLAQAAGLQTDQGVLVNDQMQTSAPHVYAAGDCAQGPNLLGGPSEVHAIQPTAVDQGRVAGANMAGKEVHYPGSLLMNVVDICGLHAASFGNWNDANAEQMTIANSPGRVYRQLLWQEDQIIGAIFVGRPNDMGMLTDVGMVKGLIQTKTALGPWKKYLRENPFDIRRAYIATGVANKLIDQTLLGVPFRGRGFQAGGAQPADPRTKAHQVFVETSHEIKCKSNSN